MIHELQKMEMKSALYLYICEYAFAGHYVEKCEIEFTPRYHFHSGKQMALVAQICPNIAQVRTSNM